MITAHNIGVEFGMQVLFQKATFSINRRDKIALVGKNGAGKSTLMKLIAGRVLPTSGTISCMKHCTVGYLSQQLPIYDNLSIIEIVRSVFQKEKEHEAMVEQLREEVSKRTDYEAADYLELVEKFTQETERLAELKSDNKEATIERVLLGLGFLRSDFERSIAEFSGGWKMRVELAKLLLQSPDVLLLDEPTNHLDIESIYWLEKYLQRMSSAVVLVSHDRTFLNNVTQRTLDISCGKIIDYKVKYNDYTKLVAERREQQLRAYESQQKEIADIKQFIERFRYQATKASQVQSRIKQLEKMEIVEVDEVDNSTLHLSFPPCVRSGDFPIIAENLMKRYGDKIVFEQTDLTIRRGEKVAFVGKNGEGKSTMVKCIMNEISFEGVLKIGHNISIGYFAQNQADLLDENLSVYDTIDRAARGDMRLKIYDLLGAFLFGKEDFEKKVKVLSGGERTRLAMIKLLLEPVNLLILDEPTNHLDLRTKDVLKNAIQSFEGTVIIVSHDRDFLEGLTNRIFEFGGGRVKEFMGSIYEYLEQKEASLLGDTLKLSAPPAFPSPPLSDAKQQYQQQKEQVKQIKKLQKSVEIAEEEVTRIEAQLKEIEAQLGVTIAPAMELLQQYEQLTKELHAAEQRWEEAVNLLEGFSEE